MNTDKTQTEWTELKGKIKQKWNKLADADVESFKGNMQAIPAKLQSAYGYTKDKADAEFAELNETLRATPAPVEKDKQN